MLSEQEEALLRYRVTEAYQRLHAVSPEHELLIHFHVREGELVWNRNDGGIYEFGFHTRFSRVGEHFSTDPCWFAYIFETPLPEKFERYICALEDAVVW